MLGKQRVEDSAMAAQQLHRRFLVLAHHLAVSGDVGGKDRREPALQRRLCCAGGFGIAGHGISGNVRRVSTRVPAEIRPTRPTPNLVQGGEDRAMRYWVLSTRRFGGYFPPPFSPCSSLPVGLVDELLGPTRDGFGETP
jgi:hypothetical protein